MNVFLKIPAYVFHPLWIPTFAGLLYFGVTPRFTFPEVAYGKLAIVFILTFLLPLALYFLLKNLQIVQSPALKTVRERKLPLLILCGLLLILLRSVYVVYDYPELYYFFLSLLISAITAYVLVVFRFKASLHLMGLAALTMFAVALSVRFHINLLMSLSVLLFSCGWLAGSRLHTRAHTPVELVMGFFVGLIPQLLMVRYWM